MYTLEVLSPPGVERRQLDRKEKLAAAVQSQWVRGEQGMQKPESLLLDQRPHSYKRVADPPCQFHFGNLAFFVQTIGDALLTVFLDVFAAGLS